MAGWSGDRWPVARPPAKRWSAVAARAAVAAGGILAFALLAALIARDGLLPLPGGNATAAAPSPTATRIPLGLTLYSHLTSIAMVSPTEGWAVGFGAASTEAPFLLHMRSGVWAREPLPPGAISPAAIAMTSATDGWIAGADHDGEKGRGVVLHLSAGRWAPIPLPTATAPITALAMVSPTEGWAVDAGSPPDVHAHILHYAQGVWTIANTLPDASTLLSISMVSPTEGWAAGRGSFTAGMGFTSGALWHYARGTWQRVTPSDPSRADVEYVSMLPTGEGWGIGSYQLPHRAGDQYQRQGGAIWRYVGGHWQVVERYVDDPIQAVNLTAIQAVPTGDVWVGESDSTGKRFLRYVDGAWQKVPALTKGVVLGIAMTGAAEGWAVGDAGQILHFMNGTWVDYPTLS